MLSSITWPRPSCSARVEGDRDVARDTVVIRVDVADGVGTITIDNTAEHNVMGEGAWRALPEVVRELAANETIRVLVLRGAGDDFSAGVQIADVESVLHGGHPGDGGLVSIAESALAGFPAPTVAAIDGYCIGGGWALAAACDIRIASARARIGVTPARLGILYPLSATQRLVHIAGPAVARRLLLTGELIDADTAALWGMVSDVAATGALWGAVDELVQTIVSRSLLTQHASKELIDLIVSGDDLTFERAAHWDRQVATSGEGRRGTAAFLAKEKPVFAWSGDPGDRWAGALQRGALTEVAPPSPPKVGAAEPESRG